MNVSRNNLQTIFNLSTKYLKFIPMHYGISKLHFLNKRSNFLFLTCNLLKKSFTTNYQVQNKKEPTFIHPTGTLNNYLVWCSEKLKDYYTWKFTFEQHGADHQPTFICTLHLNGPAHRTFVASSFNKKDAQAKVSEKALAYFYSENQIDLSGRPLILARKTSPSTGLKLLKKEIPIYLDEDFILKTKRMKQCFNEELLPLLRTTSEEDLGIIKDENEKGNCFNIMTGDFHDTHTYHSDASRDEEMSSQLAFMQEREKQNYPIYAIRDEILDTVEKNAITIIEGGTGSGKSTQVPQMILDDWVKKGKGSDCNIVVAQPRRLATLSVAHWVSCERREEIGDSVGYKMRLDDKFLRERGGIMFYTCGSLRELMNHNCLLKGVSHIIIDEIHERSIDNDFLLLMVKVAMQKIKDESSTPFKLILMSATAQVDVLQAYFDTDAVVRLKGRSFFPLNIMYIDQITQSMRKQQHTFEASMTRQVLEKKVEPRLIANVVRFIHATKDEGAILVFLPGWNDILSIERLLAPDEALCVLPLHSRLTKKEQGKIFDRSPDGQRKVILATNIAETSITVDDVVYVIDTGLENNIWYNPAKNISTFGPCWISKANAHQRSGRAGRVRAGHVFRLYDERVYRSFDDFPQAEMRKLPLDWVVLWCKSIFEESEVRDLLNDVIEPPSSLAVSAAMESLAHLGMLVTEISNGVRKESITPLGRAVCKLSISPSLAKATIFAYFFGYKNLALNTMALENRPDQLFDDKMGAKDFHQMKVMWHATSDHLAFSILLHKIELALRRGQIVEKWDFEAGEADRIVTVKDRKWILTEMDTDVIEPINHISWETFEDFTRLKVLLQNQMKMFFPELDSLPFKQYSFKELLKMCELEDAVFHYNIFLGCLLSAADSIIREIPLDEGSSSLRVIENGKKLSLRSSSVLSQCTNDDSLYFSSNMQFWMARNSFLTGNLSRVSPLAVALFYGERLELTTEDNTTYRLQVKQRQLFFVTDERTAKSIMDLRNMFTSILNHYLEDLPVDSTQGGIATIQKFTIELKELIHRIMEEEEYQLDSCNSIEHCDST